VAAAATPPRNATEAALLALWQELLENDRFGVHDSFFELGGHSLLAIRLAAGIKARFELEVPLRKLFELPSVAELAVYLEALLLDKLETLSDEEALQLLQRSGGLAELDEVQASC
jgi:acyl carrier protein